MQVLHESVCSPRDSLIHSVIGTPLRTLMENSFVEAFIRWTQVTSQDSAAQINLLIWTPLISSSGWREGGREREKEGREGCRKERNVSARS